MKPLGILAAGMVTGVGLDAPSSCAAIRCAIDNFSETRFMDKGGEWIIGSQVPLEQPWRGLPKLVHMVVPAIRECLAQVDVSPERIPLLLCVAEKERPGRLEGLDDELFLEIQAELGIRFHPRSVVIPRGRVAGGLAMLQARDLIHDVHFPYCIIAGVDNYLTASTLSAYEEMQRLLTSENSNGFIPGEAGAAILVGAAPTADLVCLGIGTGLERSTVQSEEPLRADGMVQAFEAAFADAGIDFSELDFRVTDSNGEQYYFKEAALALSRTFRVRKGQFDIWHPADCIGEAGAAIGPCAVAVVLFAIRKNYAPGPGILGHFSADNGDRVALVMRSANTRKTDG